MSFKKQFKQNKIFKCDLCHNLGPNHFSDNKIDQNLSKKYLDFENCSHKICFLCIENRSNFHGIPLSDIECIRCKKIQQDKDIETKIFLKEYCHCPENVKKQIINKRNQDNKPKTVEDIYSYNMNIMRIMSFGFGSGLPIIYDKCKTCDKSEKLYLGIHENMNKLYPDVDWYKVE